MRSLIAPVFCVAALLFVNSGALGQDTQPTPAPTPSAPTPSPSNPSPPWYEELSYKERGQYHPCPASVSFNNRPACLGCPVQCRWLPSDLTAIEPLIAPDYNDSYHYSKNALIHHCRDRLAQPLAEKIITRITQIDIAAPKATAVFTVRIVFDKQSLPYQSFVKFMLLKVKLNLQKQPDNRWLLRQVEILEVNRQPIDWRKLLYSKTAPAREHSPCS